jgi:predicted butyrate kinase (DUF1464 family)
MCEYLNESILEGLTELLSSSIAFSWILSGENSEMRMCFNDLLRLNDE